MSAGLEQAKLDAERARKRLASTLGELQQRLKPGALAGQAWSGVREKGSEIADDAVEAVRERPAATAGVLAAFALFLARGQIISAASRLAFRRKNAKKPKKETE
ncbi:MAG: DUF3618 domain-containing protein [Sphingomonadales bacterium]|jgi:ElaB/YqjD/DUF883 family membrane-anchored ribosome-binding protein